MLFDEKFEVFLADTEAARRIHYGIRYQVYCRETGFEDAGQFPDRLERDHWDPCAVPFLVRHRWSGQWIATMRLILGGDQSLPVEGMCRIENAKVLRLPGQRKAELSRLCMVKEFRRRGEEPKHPFEIEGVGGKDVPAIQANRRERRREPEILLGLLRAGFRFSETAGLDYWVILITPALARMLQRINTSIERIGPSCAHRGQRFPYVTQLAREERQISEIDPEVADMLGRGPAYLRFSQAAAEGQV